MPRIARQKSESGIYHIMLRGANRQQIFHEDEDNIMFLEILKRYKKKAGIIVLGWCLMGNHIHLLLMEGKEDISLTMKRIGVSFVWHYNLKYGTTGHLFQDRFKSEEVESDEYLLTVIRYIHQNPVKAEIVKRAEEWKWSSCLGYYGGKVYPENLLDNEIILKIFSKDSQLAIKSFKNFNESYNNDTCLDFDDVKIRLSDEDCRQEILRQIGDIKIPQIKSLPKEKRDELLRRIKGIEGINQRQAARLLGVSQTLISRA